MARFLATHFRCLGWYRDYLGLPATWLAYLAGRDAEDLGDISVTWLGYNLGVTHLDRNMCILLIEVFGLQQPQFIAMNYRGWNNNWPLEIHNSNKKQQQEHHQEQRSYFFSLLKGNYFVIRLFTWVQWRDLPHSFSVRHKQQKHPGHHVSWNYRRHVNDSRCVARFWPPNDRCLRWGVGPNGGWRMLYGKDRYLACLVKRNVAWV